MSGPCSLPNGDKAEWERLNTKICGIHHECFPSKPKMGKEGKALSHDFVTRRIWLARRNRLATGKTR